MHFEGFHQKAVETGNGFIRRTASAHGQQQRCGAADAAQFAGEPRASYAGHLHVSEDQGKRFPALPEQSERRFSGVRGFDCVPFGCEEQTEELAAHLVVVDEQDADGIGFGRHRCREGYHLRPGFW
jgi:hypothetical protein